MEWMLVRRSLAETLTDEERRQLEAWLEASPDHRAFYNRIAGFDREEGIQGLTEAECERDLERFVTGFRQYKRKGKRGRVVYLARYAAVLVVLVTAGVYLWYGSRTEGEEPVASPLAVQDKTQTILRTDEGLQVSLAAAGLQDALPGGAVASGSDGISYSAAHDKAGKTWHHTLIVPRGGEYRVTLADGSVVWINSETEFSYPVSFTDSTREVTLWGEAYFEVAKEDKPFKVRVNGAVVKVYGTRFNVNGYDPRRVQTVLVSGSVGVSSSARPLKERMIRPNEMAEVNPETGDCVVSEVDASAYVAWKEGYFSFEGERLEEIMEKLSRWYDVEVVFVDEELRGQRFTGRAERNEDFRGVLNLLERTLLVKFMVEGNKITITR